MRATTQRSDAGGDARCEAIRVDDPSSAPHQDDGEARRPPPSPEPAADRPATIGRDRRPAVAVRYPAEIRQAVARRCTQALRDGVIPELWELRDRLVATLERESPASLLEVVADGRSVVAGEIEGLRHFINELHPALIDRHGFLAALRALVHQTATRDGVDSCLEATPSEAEPPLSAEVAISIYRMVEEAIRNSVEHAQATRIVVEIRADPDLSVEVTDDGRGFKPATAQAGFGLATMRERAQLIDALVHLESAPGHGTRMRIDLPMRSAGGLAFARETLDAEMIERRERLRRGVSTQEAECARWAREIHDDTLQHLAAAISHAWPLNRGDEIAVQHAAEVMRAGIDDALVGLGELIDDLALSPPGRLGLAASLEALAQRALSDARDIVVDISPGIRPPESVDDLVAVYRIVQEALTNAVKHSRASLVKLSARQTPTGLTVTVSDNGVGFDTAATPSGFGMTCMTERAELLGADLLVNSRMGTGVTVRLSIPSVRSGELGRENCA